MSGPFLQPAPQGPLAALRVVSGPGSGGATAQPEAPNTIRVSSRPGKYSAAALGARQIRALVALASGATDEAAARVACVSQKTIVRWRRSPEFAQELQGLLVKQRERIEGILGALAAEAETVLRAALSALDDNGRPAHATRLRSAEGILSHYTRISQRIEAAPQAPVGPLIILPPGTQRMALALDAGLDDRPRPVGPPQAPDGLFLSPCVAPPDDGPIDVTPLAEGERVESESSLQPTQPPEARPSTTNPQSQEGV